MASPTNRFMGTALPRRSMLRGAGMGIAGLAGAALIGCGGGSSAPAASNTGGNAGADSGAPKKVVRADGFDPKLGAVPVNTKKKIEGGTYRRAATDTSRENDPEVSIAGADWEIVGDRLATANGFNQKVSPDMLASFEISDPLTIILKLRPGIKTHNVAPLNGRVFTAKDAALSIKRKAGLLDLKTAQVKYARYAQFDGLTDAVAVDDVTIKLTLSKPNGSIMAALSDPRASMLPVEMFDIGFKDPMKFGGTGAWIPTAYVDGTRQTFKANKEYYRTWDEGGRPGVDTYEKVVLTDRGSLVAAFISGQIDTLTAVRPEEEPQLKSSVPGAQMSLTPGPTWDHFAVNMKLPQFQDDRVRQAFQLAMDYKAFSEPLGRGWLYTGPVHSMFPESIQSEEIMKLPGYNPDTKAKDIAEAAKLMEAAGFKEGQGMGWKQINSSPASIDSSVRVKDIYTKAFPKINITVSTQADYAQFTTNLNGRTYEGRSYNHTSVPDVVADAVTYYHTKGGRNYQSFSKPWADEAMEKLQQAIKLEDRKAILRDFSLRYIKEGPPLLHLRVPADNIAIQSHVAGNDLVIGPWAYNSYGVSPRFVWFTEK